MRVRGLTCSYGSDPVLDNLSFRVSRGEIVGITGHSGCGKTTLAHCLAGIKAGCDVKGEVIVDGINVLEEKPSVITKRINIIMQNFEIQIFGLTVEDDIVFGLENLDLPHDDIEKRLEWALKTFKLEKYRHYRISELSGGLKQKVVIASTVILDPEFVIMDDPTSNLDWPGVCALKSIMSWLKSQNKGVIILARRIKGLEEVLDRFYVLEGGRLKAAKADCAVSSLKKIPKLKCERKPVVGVRDLWFKYSQGYILKNVHLRVNSSEVVTIMGPNGSGKTTLVKHLNGLLKPTKGSVEIMGQNVNTMSTAEMAKYVAFVFQDPDRHITNNTVWEEAAFGCRNLGLPDDHAKRALSMMGLADAIKMSPYALNMGGKTRLSIASALATDPKILVLDEPTTGQDAKTLEVLKNTILNLRSGGKTIVVVTHDSDFALEISDRVVVLHSGRIVADSVPDEILRKRKFLEAFELEPPLRRGDR